jgi:hypothetical protein
MRTILKAAAAAALLSLGACGDREADDRKADNIIEEGENKADALDEAADNAATENQADALENKADAVREKAENKAEAVEENKG